MSTAKKTPHPRAQQQSHCWSFQGSTSVWLFSVFAVDILLVVLRLIIWLSLMMSLAVYNLMLSFPRGVLDWIWH